MTIVRILSATYGPSMDQHHHATNTSSIQNLGVLLLGYDHGTQIQVETRDVLPFIQILLQIASEKIASSTTTNINTAEEGGITIDSIWGDVKIHPYINTLTLLEAGHGMNNIFGDPAPGITKKLSLTYTFLDNDDDDNSKRKESFDLMNGESISSCSFSEHESIVLKRFTRLTSEIETKIDILNSYHQIPSSTIKRVRSSTSSSFSSYSSSSSSRKLCSPIWEWLLPMILPFLELRQRVDSQCVCKIWRSVIQEWGYLPVLDVSNSSISITPSLISGVLAQSYASLHSLYLARFHQLDESILLTALPQLRKLTTLDISYCSQLGDATLEALSQHSRYSLEVLYIKGLKGVTDQGISCIAQGCTNLRVLDISFVQITDTSAVLIGNSLTRLEALYLRDNYMLTNRSIDVISKKCIKLKQLTLWGCIKLSHFLGDSKNPFLESCCSENLVLLNLWGVHSLTDGIASSIKTLVSLRTLIVSECHKLSDSFVINIANSVIGPRIQHFHLRFLRKLTDTSVMAIAHNMTSLYSLDLSFCTFLTIDSIVLLIERTSTFLCELRLYNCCQLDLTLPVTEVNSAAISTESIVPKMSIAGTRLFDALCLHGKDGTLCLLDIRGCAGNYPTHETRMHDKSFVGNMDSLGYTYLTPGFFQRTNQWTDTMKQHYYSYLRE